MCLSVLKFSQKLLSVLGTVSPVLFELDDVISHQPVPAGKVEVYGVSRCCLEGILNSGKAGINANLEKNSDCGQVIRSAFFTIIC